MVFILDVAAFFLLRIPMFQELFSYVFILFYFSLGCAGAPIFPKPSQKSCKRAHPKKTR